ncbi:hypothetical protein E4U42_001357 [Claviceps africana]|uniref:Uncharacterized protein n=1 Tax=Claviceps africana TaxID=83212 RepID=A0A8K0JCY6_9HYPO|nr:hypothetical protein E4U42_001357 [Claviceps africana]
MTTFPPQDEGGYQWILGQGPLGSARDLKNLVNAAREKDMFVMVDFVTTHVGPGPIADKLASSIVNCRVACNLPHVSTRDSEIRGLYQNGLRWLVVVFKFEGLRIDTFGHVQTDFWLGLLSETGGPLLSLLNYPVYFSLNRFHQQRVSDTHSHVWSMFPKLVPRGTFLDKNDDAHFLNQRNDVAVLKNLLACVMLARGVPVTYRGGAHAYDGEKPWRTSFSTNNELYKFLSAVWRT